MDFVHSLSFILFVIEINADVSVKMATDTNSIGRVIVLTCTVHGIQIIDIETTRQWSMGDDDKLLCYNGRINNLKKYKEKILQGNVFSLTIFNVTESDLNVMYLCRYGFEAASKFIETSKHTLFLSLKLVTDHIIFGGSIILTCTLNGTGKVDSDVTRQWSMGKDDELLSYNGRINNHRKYEETLFPGNKFSLKIANVTAKDVNVTYRCRYGFNSARKFIEIKEYDYNYLPTFQNDAVRYLVDNHKDTICISIYLEKIITVPRFANCSITTKEYAPVFHLTDMRETEEAMTVNLSLSLKKRIACSTIFNVSCHIARKKYNIPNVNLTDVCDSEEKIENNSIFVVILISSLVFALISVIVIVKFVSRRQNNKKKDSKARKPNDNEDMVECEQIFIKSEDKQCNNIA